MKNLHFNNSEQLKLFDDIEFNSMLKGIAEEEFKTSFKPYAESVYNVILKAHDDVLKQFSMFPAHSNSYKAQTLNDRIQRMLKEDIPNAIVRDAYNILCLNIDNSYICLFKKIGSTKKPLPKFSETKRALQKFSYGRCKGSSMPLKYILIGYKVSDDFQQLEEVIAVNTNIDKSKRILTFDWAVNLDTLITNHNIRIDSNFDIFDEIEEFDTSELPKIKRKSS